MTTDLIRYDLLAQEALRGVVRKVLEDASKAGLPGEHHFYVSFDTGAPGVKISPRVREKYPEEMTIVLQHQFWDLIVTDTTFEVGLSFGGIPERLLVPFDALTGFFDPSVKFGVKFEPAHTLSEEEPAAPEDTVTRLVAVPSSGEKAPKEPAKSRPVRKSKVTGPEKEASDSQDNATADTPTPEPEKNDDSAGAQIVSLDKFRKK
jgi:hypothetical protein